MHSLSPRLPATVVSRSQRPLRAVFDLSLGKGFAISSDTEMIACAPITLDIALKADGVAASIRQSVVDNYKHFLMGNPNDEDLSRYQWELCEAFQPRRWNYAALSIVCANASDLAGVSIEHMRKMVTT